jgi:hypothetical protein
MKEAQQSRDEWQVRATLEVEEEERPFFSNHSADLRAILPSR